MKIIQTGDVYYFHNDSVKTFDILPPKTFSVEYDEDRLCCYLMEHSDLEVSEKAYGVQEKKADKVMSTFLRFPRSLGVILSGDKGIGKTMFAKKLCMRSIAWGMPVILVERLYPQLVRFLESIDQECLVLFDEFDKTFGTSVKHRDDGEDSDEQGRLLSFFDGTSGGKKLFVVTCNELLRLNDCLINRPGRFHYHFTFAYPTEGEIEEYMCDHLEEQYRNEIPKIVAFSRRVPLNYDCLRAIAMEINCGADFKEAIEDLNILNAETVEYDVTLYFENGRKLYCRRYRADLYDDESFGWTELSDEQGKAVADLCFNKEMLHCDAQSGALLVPARGLSLIFEDYDSEDREISTIKRLKPSQMVFERCTPRSWNYST